MTLFLNNGEEYVRRNESLIFCSSCRRGLFSAVLTLKGDEYFQISIWAHYRGLLRMGSSRERRVADRFSTRQQGSIVWNPTGDRLCLLYSNEMTIFQIDFQDLKSKQNFTLDEVIAFFSGVDGAVLESIQVKITPLQRQSFKNWNDISPTSACLCDMGRCIIVGTEYPSAVKMSWDGTATERITLSGTSNWNISQPMNITFHALKTGDPAMAVSYQSNMLLGDKLNVEDKDKGPGITVRGWSERLRMAIAIHDDSLLLLRSLKDRYAVSPTVNLQMGAGNGMLIIYSMR